MSNETDAPFKTHRLPDVRLSVLSGVFAALGALLTGIVLKSPEGQLFALGLAVGIVVMAGMISIAGMSADSQRKKLRASYDRYLSELVAQGAVTLAEQSFYNATNGVAVYTLAGDNSARITALLADNGIFVGCNNQAYEVATRAANQALGQGSWANYLQIKNLDQAETTASSS